MKFQRNNFVLIFLIVVSLGHVSKMFAQNEKKQLNSEEVWNVYLSEGIPQEVLNNMEMNSLIMVIRNDQGKSVATLPVETYKDFSFSIPGTYTVELTSEHLVASGHEDCNHSDHNRIVMLEVLPYSIQFDFDNMKLSTEIIGGKDMSNETLTIPVIVKTYSNQELKTGTLKLSTAGVNTTLQGNVKDEQLTLNEGVNLVAYQLKGSSSKNTYIMFDFYDMDGRIHSFGYTTQIK